MNRLLALAYGALCYITFLASFAAFVLFLSGVGIPWTVDHGPPISTAEALLVNLELLLLFGLQHSGMARRAFKRWWTRVVPPIIERSTYVLASSLIIGLIIGQWRPIPGVVWQIEHPFGAGLLWALFGAGWAIALVATFLISHAELFGLQQVWARWTGTTPEAPAFQTPLLYRIMRHPMQAGIALGLWATPTMTAGHLLLAAGLTVYILIGLYFEERDLLSTFGDRYAAYQQRVPMLIPRGPRRWLQRAPDEPHATEQAN